MKQTKRDGRDRVPAQDLEALGQRLTHWRETRERGQHIPAVLWKAAAQMARQYGLERVAHDLHLDIDRLKRQLSSGAVDVLASQADCRFIEMRVSPITTTAESLCECTVELENGRGAKMRVQLSGDGLVGLGTLCSSFLSAP